MIRSDEENPCGVQGFLLAGRDQPAGWTTDASTLRRMMSDRLLK